MITIVMDRGASILEHEFMLVDEVSEINSQFNCLCLGGDTVSACGIMRFRIIGQLMMIPHISSLQ